MSLEELKRRASALFRLEFHAEPRVCAVAPGRVNLIGEHVDYCDGFVLPMVMLECYDKFEHFS